MKKYVLSVLSVILLCALAMATPYKINFAPSPDETNSAVLQYVGEWSNTNKPTGIWIPFGDTAAGTTNIYIPVTVPSPAYITVVVQGTNGVVSIPITNNMVLYNTNTLAGIYGSPAAPRPPAATPTLSN